MKHLTVVLLLSVFIAVGVASVSGQAPEKPRPGFLSVLKSGQSVNVKEVAGRFEILLMEEVPLSHKVTEVGADHVVVEDIAGVNETRIPVYSIKAIVRLKFPTK